MPDYNYLEPDLHSCKLCEWRCGVDRLSGELGVCGITIPKVASSQLHPAPPASFDAFLVGCNLKCLFCQNWTISMFDESEPQMNTSIEGYYDPEAWAELGVTYLTMPQAQLIGADRLFFTGGEPTCSLPWVEKVVRAANDLIPSTKVNFDTNGYMTKDSLNRILKISTSITYDLKAFDPELFQALTGASVKPVLRNLKQIIKTAPEKLWEVRVMVIPGIHDFDVDGICKFLADLNPEINLNFLAFRPNFIMETYPGATVALLDHCVNIAKEYGLVNSDWSGRLGIIRKIPKKIDEMVKSSVHSKHIAIPLCYAALIGCSEVVRNCGNCKQKEQCVLKNYKS